MACGRLIGWVALALAVVAVAPTALIAADWGGISPGASTMGAVFGRYGAPSRESHEKLEGYDTTRWIYDGAKAPPGVKRLAIDFGLLTPSGYRADLVRYFELDPKPQVFDRGTIIQGWGPPDRVGEEEGRKLFFYKAGLVVYLDATEENAVSMYFTLPQPEPPASK